MADAIVLGAKHQYIEHTRNTSLWGIPIRIHLFRDGITYVDVLRENGKLETGTWMAFEKNFIQMDVPTKLASVWYYGNSEAGGM